MTRAVALTGLVLVSALGGCVTYERPTDYGDPTSLATPTEADGIIAWIAKPSLSGVLDNPAPTIVIGAYVEGDQVLLEVSVSRLSRDADGNELSSGTRRATREGEGEEQRFSAQVGLLHGDNRFLAKIETPDRSRVRRMVFNVAYDGQAPGISVDLLAADADAPQDDPCRDATPIEPGLTNAAQLCVQGQVSSRGGAGVAVTLAVPEVGAERTPALEPDGSFEGLLPLRPDANQTLVATARDAAGHVASVETILTQDATPPELVITTDARETAAPSLTLEGTAEDASGVVAVELQSGGQTQLRADDPAAWSLSIPLPHGDSEFELVARDRAGNEAREALTLSRLRTLWLGPPDPQAGATDLELDRDAIGELLTVENQQSIELVSVDVRPTVREALERIRQPERFGVDTTDWADAERNLQRILAMTSDNADLSGTSLEELLMIAEGLGLPAPRLLAQLLDLGLTDPIMDLDYLTDVVMDQLVGTHPNIGRDGDAYVIEVDLYDVLNDLTTLAPRFGPVGAHPGFLSGESYAAVLEGGFRVTFPVQSNLVQYDGIDMSRQTKDFHFLVEGDRVLDFNILSDDFAVVGLRDEPTVDLRFVLDEHPGPGMLGAGATRDANPDVDEPGFFRGDGQGWGVDPWLFEHIAVEAAYRQFHRHYPDDGFARVLRYDAGAITDAAVIDWDHGWVSISTAGGVGNPPAPVYIWDFIMEVAQVRLHDGNIPEGDANMGFDLTEVPIGLTAEQLVDKLQPSLHEQEDVLSEQLVGDLGLAVPRAELFYMPAEGKSGALAFPAAEDSAAEYAYVRPGFFSDAKLTDKVSKTGKVGGVEETLHEKVPAKVGAVYYVADEEDVVYQVTIAERDGERIGLRISAVEAQP